LCVYWQDETIQHLIREGLASIGPTLHQN